MATTERTLRIPVTRGTGRRSWLVAGLVAAALVGMMIAGLELQGSSARPVPAQPALGPAYLGPISGTGPGLTEVAAEPAPPVSAVSGTGPDLLVVARDWSFSAAGLGSRGAVHPGHRVRPVSSRGNDGPSAVARCGTSVGDSPC
jgi:hypothetical protein